MSYNGPVNIQVDGAREDPRAQVLVAQGRRMLGALDVLARANPKQAAVARQWGNDQVGYVKAVWTPNIKTMYVVVPSGAPVPPQYKTVKRSRKLPDKEIYQFCTNGLFFHHPEHGPLLLPAGSNGLVMLPSGLDTIEAPDDLLIMEGQAGAEAHTNPTVKEKLVPKSGRVRVFTEPAETQSMTTGNNNILCLEEMGAEFYPKPFTLVAPRAVYFAAQGAEGPEPFHTLSGRLLTSSSVVMWSDFAKFPEDMTYSSMLDNLGWDYAGDGASQNALATVGKMDLDDTNGVPVEDSREWWYHDRPSVGHSFARSGKMAVQFWQRRRLENGYRNLQFLQRHVLETAPCGAVVFRQPLADFTPYLAYRHVSVWHGIPTNEPFPGTLRDRLRVTISPVEQAETSAGYIETLSNGPDEFDVATVTAWFVRSPSYVRFRITPGYWDYHYDIHNYRRFFDQSAMINHRQTGINPFDYTRYDALHGYPFLVVYSEPRRTAPVADGTTVDVYATGMQSLNNWDLENKSWPLSSSVVLPNVETSVSFLGTLEIMYDSNVVKDWTIEGDLSHSGTWIPPGPYSEDGLGHWDMWQDNPVPYTVSQVGEFNIAYSVTGVFTLPDEITGVDIVLNLHILQEGHFPVDWSDSGIMSNGTILTAISSQHNYNTELATKGEAIVTLGGVELGPGGGDIFPTSRPMDEFLPGVWSYNALCLPAAGFYWAVEDRGDSYLLTIFGDAYEEIPVEIDGVTDNHAYCRKCVTAVVLKGKVLGGRVVAVKKANDHRLGVQNVTDTDVYDVVHNPVTGQTLKIKDMGDDTVRAAFLHVSSKLKYSKLLLKKEGRTIEWEEPDGA